MRPVSPSPERLAAVVASLPPMPQLRMPWTARPMPALADVAEVCGCHPDAEGWCRRFAEKVLAPDLLAMVRQAGLRVRFHAAHACPHCRPLSWHCAGDGHVTSGPPRRRLTEDDVYCRACRGPLRSEGGCFEIVRPLVRVSEPTEAVTPR